MRLKFVVLTLAALVASACSSATGSNETKTVTGTVRFVSIAGGFYALRGDDSVTYDPTNLAPEYRSSGLRVQARVEIRRDLLSPHQAGPIVDILHITVLPRD